MVFQAWVFGRQFLQNIRSEPIISRKSLIVFVANNKIPAFQAKKSSFGKIVLIVFICIYHQFFHAQRLFL